MAPRAIALLATRAHQASRLVALSVAVVLAALGLASPARAAGPAFCALDRSPFLPWPALPAELQCDFDQDGNGLDDVVERQIAACVIPALRFDSRENALRPDEPHAIFTAYRSGMDEITVNYGFLYEWDGGFTLDDDVGCGDDHAGDSQGLSVVAKVERGWSTWQAQALRSNDGLVQRLGTHFVAYPTAGKHHWKTGPGNYLYDVKWAGLCRDEANGQGVYVIPGSTTPGRGSLTHVPVYGSWTQLGDGFLNACVQARSGEDVAAAGFRSVSLDDLGYPGQSLFASFYDVSSPWKTIAPSVNFDPVWDLCVPGVTGCFGAVNPDVDGDGLWEALPPAYLWARRTGQPTAPYLPNDPCPIDGTDQTDDDGDRLAGACDPDTYFRNVYVAGGSAALPAYDLKRHSTLDGAPRAGFLDSDGDGLIEGEDFCPNDRRGGGRNSNRWGEQENFQRSAADELRDAGAFYRGDACDPYPATSTVWLESGVPRMENDCKPIYRSWGGADVVSFAARTNAGRSMNDPFRDEPDERRFSVNAYRCACDEVDGDACLSDPNSKCFARMPADPRAPIGRGWRPVERDDCSHDAEGWCSPLEFTPVQGKALGWAWRKEARERPEHFAPGDVLELAQSPANRPFGGYSAEARLKYSYALMTQTQNGRSFTEAPGEKMPWTWTFPEPEQTPAGVHLLDIRSEESHWLRSSVAEPRAFTSPWEEWSFGKLCRDPLVMDEDWWCVFASCNSPLFDPQIFFDPGLLASALALDPVGRDAWAGHRIFWPGRLLGDGRLGDARTGAVQSIALADAPEWLLAVEGSGAAAPWAGEVAGGTNLLWVEHSAENARWALLASEAVDARAEHVLLAQGELEAGATAGARIVASGGGEVFALFDPGARQVAVFDAAARAWTGVPAPEALFDLAGAAVAMLGPELVVLGLPAETGPSTVAFNDRAATAWRLHLGTGEARAWNAGVPGRAGALLTLGAEAGTLVFRGGVDSAGRAHDDAWLLHPASGAAEQLTPDGERVAPRREALLVPRADLRGAVAPRAVALTPGLALRDVAVPATSGWRMATCPSRELAFHALFAVDGVVIGADASVQGTVGSAQGGVFLDRRAAVASVVTGGDLVQAPGAEAGSHVTTALSGLDCLDPVSAKEARPPVLLAFRRTRALAPGSYGPVVIGPRATLRLTEGNYALDSLTVLPGGRVELGAGGRVRVETRSALVWAGEVAEAEANARRLLWVHRGAGPVLLGAPFAGTLLAPDTSVLLRDLVGAVFAKQIAVLPGGTILGERLEGDLR